MNTNQNYKTPTKCKHKSNTDPHPCASTIQIASKSVDSKSKNYESKTIWMCKHFTHKFYSQTGINKEQN